MNEQHNRDAYEPDSGQDNVAPPQPDNAEIAVPPIGPTKTNPSIKDEKTEESDVHTHETSGEISTNSSTLVERLKQAERWMIVLTAIIAVATAANVIVYYLESEGAGKQTQKLIDAANIQVGAATKNAESAAKSAQAASNLSGETKDIAQRALAQAQATNALATEAKRSANNGEAANRIAFDAMKLSQRPWVGIDDTPQGMQITPLTFDAQGDGKINTTVRMRNFSGGAAQNVRYLGFLVISEDIAAIRQKQIEACRKIGSPQSTDVLFPTRDRRLEGLFGYVARDQIKIGRNGKTEAWWVGCIGYRDQFEAVVYYTKFVYMLQTEAGRPIEFEPTANTTIPGAFRLRESSIGESNAQH